LILFLGKLAHVTITASGRLHSFLSAIIKPTASGENSNQAVIDQILQSFIHSSPFSNTDQDGDDLQGIQQQSLLCLFTRFTTSFRHSAECVPFHSP
jgi:hypothetical protein